MGLLEDMSCPPNELWAHSGEHGWIVYDDNDPRNSGPGRRVIIRCKDWAEIEVPRGEPKPPAYVPFRMYFNCLGGREVEREVANLLALQHSFALRKHEIVAQCSGVGSEAAGGNGKTARAAPTAGTRFRVPANDNLA